MGSTECTNHSARDHDTRCTPSGIPSERAVTASLTGARLSRSSDQLVEFGVLGVMTTDVSFATNKTYMDRQER